MQHLFYLFLNLFDKLYNYSNNCFIFVPSETNNNKLNSNQMTTYKNFNIQDSGLVRFRGHYVNTYDSVSSAIYAIDKGDADFTIALKISKILKDSYDFISKIDAIKFIKKERGLAYSVGQIVKAWFLAYGK